MYAKLFTSIYQGTLRGNSHGLLVFTNLLAHCDKDGCVDMHPRAIAEEVGLSVDQVRVALAELESPDEESRSPEEDGRRIIRMDEHRDWGWLVVNYAKYRAIRSEDDRREQNRLAQERWRNKNKPPSAEVSHDKPIQKQKHKQKQEEANTPARKRAAAARLVSVSDLVADGVERQAAEDWLTNRAAKGAPLTPTAWKQTKTEADKAGLTVAQAVSVAAGNGWAGFKAAWIAGRMSPGQSAAHARIAAAAPGLLPRNIETMEVVDVSARRLG